jgi:glycosyltransferase involved in cell wall biosynthesis
MVREKFEPASNLTPDISANMVGSSPVVALLGKKDVPTDGVEDYCRFLSPAMGARGYVVEIVRVPWEELGWIRAWMRLWRESREWKGKWVLLQYTALMWSRRGFPLAFLVVLLTLKVRRARLVTVFHDAAPYFGKRMADRVRGACQRWVLRRAYGWTRASVLPVPMEEISWLARPAAKTRFIPVGPNIPTIARVDRAPRSGNEPKTIAVFGITDGGDISQEVLAITQAAAAASQHVRQVRLVTLGRGSRESEPDFRSALAGSSVEYQALGILSAEEVSRVLADCDVALFVRGRITTQRGSAMAVIASGTPLVAYGEPDAASHLIEAGIVLVPLGDQKELAKSVVRVLTDEALESELRRRNQRAHATFFSWEAIAEQLGTVLDNG